MLDKRPSLTQALFSNNAARLSVQDLLRSYLDYSSSVLIK
jgi:hypothetical protein